MIIIRKIREKLIQIFKISSSNYSDIWKLPVGIILILLLTISPLLIGFLGSEIHEFFTGNTCHEGNCFWMVLPWFMFISIPAGLLLIIMFLIKSLKNIYSISKMNKKKKLNN
jgi:hypothetical protein